MSTQRRSQRCAVAFALVLTSARIAASAPDSSSPRFVPNVVGAWNGLSQRADTLVFARNGAPEPTDCKHVEGIARKDGPDGTPYLIFTKSGLVPDTIACTGDHEPGYLMVARMSSRGKSGERMGTNTLPFDVSLPDVPSIEFDEVVAAIPFDGKFAPAYRHPGGVQVMGDVLAIGVENPAFASHPRATILFFDITNPENPVYTSRLDPLEQDGADAQFGADPVGLAAVRAQDGACCTYLMVVAGGPANKVVRFYRSEPDPGETTTDLKSVDLRWRLAGRYTEAELEACPGVGDWPEGSGLFDTGQHQMLNFVREGSLDGALYMIGGRRTGAIVNQFADENLDLYRVHMLPSGDTATCPLTHVSTRTMSRSSWADSLTIGTFSAGSSTHVTPSGELIVYATRHAPQDGETFVFGEYRIGSLVRANSPTLRPTASIGGPFAVDEGSSVTLTGVGAPPITKAFIELFVETNVGLPDTEEAWFSVEFDTRNDAAFDQFDRLGVPADDINEAASSWRWFAPAGCTISANDYPRRSDEFPGPDTVHLRGTGQFQEVLNLESLPVGTPSGAPYPVSPPPAGTTSASKDFDNDIGGVSFYTEYRDADGSLVRDHGCERYYNAHFTLGWDLDADGSFESSGDAVAFTAAELDGPSTAAAAARATHPTDTSAAGTGAPFPVAIEVRNVKPEIATVSLKDSLGYDVADGVRPVVAGLPVSLAVTFTDAGRPDTQTGVVDWGDGILDTSFSFFVDARGGATGTLRDTRALTKAAGPTTITTMIVDDDGGATSAQRTVRVLSLREAIGSVADALTTQINDPTTVPRVASALLAARDELIGNHGGDGSNGAIDKLDAEDLGAAITKLRAALADLATAEARGAGSLTTHKDLLGQVAEGIATNAYTMAEAKIPSPTNGQARVLATVAALIAQGHQELSGRLYLDACQSFRQATNKALALL